MQDVPRETPYVYSADSYCSRCVVEAMAERNVDVSTGGTAASCTENHLDLIAARMGLDRDDERSFDSDDFPKVSPWEPKSMIHDRCASCEQMTGTVKQPALGEDSDSENHLGTWTNSDGWTALRLDMWDHGPDLKSPHRTLIAYTLYADSELVFHGTDYSPAPSLGIDSNRAAGGLIGFLACKPGDVEEDYFKDYSERQLEFAREHGDDLALWANDLEGDSQ